MILSNNDIVRAIDDGDIVIEPFERRDPGVAPFNTTTMDLRLAPQITVPHAVPAAQRLDRSYDAAFIARNSEELVASSSQPYALDPNRFVLARTLERIRLPIRPGRPVYAARVEGKSSRARLGMLVHFSAPTVHSGFEGHITLEVINLAPNSIQLVPNVYICQVVFERVASTPDHTPSQFRGQGTAAGELSEPR